MLGWRSVSEAAGGGVEIDHAVVRAVGVFGKAIGVVVSLPAPIDQVTEFITLAGGQVDSCPPNPIARLSQGDSVFIPVVKGAGDINPVGPNTRGELEHDADETSA